ncbi:hypothetical protein AGMMS50267_06370 [Spirochaetia bacterium]|nr:hypothetical protein AGMMS50267_06370 [Spirochaetia bacterium]
MTGMQYYCAAAKGSIGAVRRITVLCVIGLLFSVPGGFAQENNAMPDTAYLIPQTVFVGDGGRLVLPLGSGFAEVEGEVLDDPDMLPRARDIVISRIELENRGQMARTGKAEPRLLIDFIAYTPGFIELPPIKIAGFTFTELQVGIASILEAEGNSRVLSPPAPPLAVPGTMEMIYGAVFGIIILILGGIFFGIRGVPVLRRYGIRRRRRRMIRSMLRLLKQLRDAVPVPGIPGADVAGAEQTAAALDRLNGEFRRFLEFITGEACTVMVPQEFLTLPPPGLPVAEGSDDQYGGPFLCAVFLRCDTLRFGSRQPKREQLTALLDDVEGFVNAAALDAETVRQTCP